jgi:hypothetical protein
MQRFQRADLLKALLRRSRRPPGRDGETSVPVGGPPTPKPVIGGAEAPVD